MPAEHQLSARKQRDLQLQSRGWEAKPRCWMAPAFTTKVTAGGPKNPQQGRGRRSKEMDNNIKQKHYVKHSEIGLTLVLLHLGHSGRMCSDAGSLLHLHYENAGHSHLPSDGSILTVKESIPGHS